MDVLFQEYYAKAMALIKIAHNGQIDKSGVEYFLHPIVVSQKLHKEDFEKYGVAALLHDVIEDTNYTASDLLKLGFKQEDIDIVVLVSRLDRSITYLEWIQKIKESRNDGAIKIKIADITHNLEFRGFDLPKGMEKRYNKALSILKHE